LAFAGAFVDRMDKAADQSALRLRKELLPDMDEALRK